MKRRFEMFDNLEQYLADLKEMLPSEEEFLKSKTQQYSVSMVMLNIINCCIDIGSEIVTLKQLGTPQTYKHIFDILDKKNILSSPLARKMKNLIGLRNLLAHEYGVIDLELLYEQANNLSFLKEFVKKTAFYFL